MTVVIVTWNSSSDIDVCLRSVRESRIDVGVRCIVVDNDSSDGTAGLVRSHHGWVDLVVNDSNVGFGRAANQGLRRVTTPFAMVLNPDTRLEPDALRALVAEMRHLEGVALCGPSLRNDEGDFEYSAARRQPTVTYQLLREGLGLNESSRVASELMRRLRSPYDLERVQSVEAVSGAAMLLRRSALEEVGVFDPSFRHCGEDVDLCARLLDAGYEIRFVPDALVWHRRGRSSRQARHRTEMEAALGLHRYFELRGSRADALAYRLVVSGVKAPRQALGALRSFWKSRDRAELQRDLALARSLVRFRPLRTCGP